jgi:plastocyanin
MKDGRVVGGTPSFPAGESRTARLHVARGDYEYLCTVGDHAELGMTGTLRVR